jgi:hypothetical protein
MSYNRRYCFQHTNNIKLGRSLKVGMVQALTGGTEALWSTGGGSNLSELIIFNRGPIGKPNSFK